jgi:hypothetical protein
MALSSTVGMVAWNSRRSLRTRPAGLFDAGWARFVRHGSILTRRADVLAGSKDRRLD